MEQKPKPSHAGRWITLVAVALPLLYVLSFPWVDFYRWEQGWTAHSLLRDDHAPSALVRAYWLPFNWLLDTPFGPWLWDYYNWCEEKAGNPRVIRIDP